MTDTNANQTPAQGGEAKAGQGGDPAAGGGSPAAGAAGSGGGNAPSVYKPEGMPDHYVGETEKDTIDKLYAAVDGFRKAQADKGVPAKADDYKLELPDDIKAQVLKPGEDGKDPMLSAFQQDAHALGLTQTQFNGMVTKLFERVTEQMAAAQQGEQGGGDALDFEFKSMGGSDAVKPLQDGVTAWANGMKANGKFDDGDIKEVSIMASYPEGLKFLAKFRELTGEKPIPVSMASAGGQDGGGEQITEAILNARVADPRYKKGTAQYDPVFFNKTTEMFQDFYNKPKNSA